MTGKMTRYYFGADRIPSHCLVSGWSRPEENHTWTIGTESILRLNYEPGDGDLQIEFGLVPFVANPRPTSQRLQVFVDNRLVCSENLDGPTWLGFRLARKTFAQTGVLTMQLLCPDATSPASISDSGDARQLGFSFRDVLIRNVPLRAPFARRVRPPVPINRYTGSPADLDVIWGLTALSPPDLANSFESLGTNCEFGLFQRRCEAEPLGLLRFAGLSYLDLVNGIAAGFAGIDEVANMTCYPDGPDGEWIVRTRSFGLEYHTNLSSADATAEAVLAAQRPILSFRRQKFLDLLSTGGKLFVVMRPQDMTEAQALPLISALRAYGPNALLFVSQQTGHPPGTVEALATDLFHGSMDGISKGRGPEETTENRTWLGDAAMTAWLSVCTNAYRLWREHGGGLVEQG
jgi:hypothetical protein